MGSYKVDSHSVECPKCGAKKSDLCSTKDGRSHRVRVDKAFIKAHDR